MVTLLAALLLVAPRVEWTTSRFHGSPEPEPSYRAAPAYPGLTFRFPTLLARAPGSARLFIGELGCKIFTIPDGPGTARADLFLDLTSCEPRAASLYGLAFHPGFERNRLVYICYVIKDDLHFGTRLSRFQVAPGGPPRADPSSEEVLLEWRAGGHNGGCLEFGPDGYLYVATGDAADPNPPDVLDTGQDLSDLLSSILRIDVDRRDPGLRYAVPADNPFVALPGARPETWAYGFRNPWKMAFDRRSGALWAGDVGWDLWEMVFRVERGGNYGWSVVEGRHSLRPGARRGPTPISPPVVEHPHTEAASITGGLVYRGEGLPELRGAYVYGDYVYGTMWALWHDGQKVTRHERVTETHVPIVAFGEDAAGEPLFADHVEGGRIYRLESNPAAGKNDAFPRKLSATGLFESTMPLRPAPGVVPYLVSSELWADGLEAERLLAVPAGGAIDASNPESWVFPDGTVLAKTLFRAAGGARRPVETQVLHLEAKAWRPYDYVWDEAGDDATLAGARARNACTRCHYYLSGIVLGATTPQLHRKIGPDGASQLEALEGLGVFAAPLSRPLDALPRLADPRDPTAPLGERARSYLHANCAHCHHSNGGGMSPLQLYASIPLEQTGALDGKLLWGSFGIEDARVIAPGDPSRSVLLYRAAKLGSGRMPRVGSESVDEAGLRLLEDWIASLPGGTPRAPRPARAAELLASTRGALEAVCLKDAGGWSDADWSEVLGSARRDTRPEVRDLFERFVPEGERIRRLGDSFDAAVVLSLAGDAARGRELFFAGNASSCGACHSAGGKGGAVGPDMSKIGTKYPREDLLRHVVEPSLTVAEDQAAYVAVTADGQAHLGIIAGKTDAEVVLRDAKGELTRLPAAEVRSLERQTASLMPEGLLRDMTAQDAADLIAYLASLR